MLLTKQLSTGAATATPERSTIAVGSSSNNLQSAPIATPITPLNTPARGLSPARRNPPLRGSLDGHSTAQHGAVLVVDDLALNRIVLGHMVRKAGLEVVEAANGAECLEQLCSNPPGRFQCILMDLQMPVMDGWEATQQVRLWEAAGHSCPTCSTNLTPASPPPNVPSRPSLSRTTGTHLALAGTTTTLQGTSAWPHPAPEAAAAAEAAQAQAAARTWQPDSQAPQICCRCGQSSDHAPDLSEVPCAGILPAHAPCSSTEGDQADTEPESFFLPSRMALLPLLPSDSPHRHASPPLFGVLGSGDMDEALDQFLLPLPDPLANDLRPLPSTASSSSRSGFTPSQPPPRRSQSHDVWLSPWPSTTSAGVPSSHSVPALPLRRIPIVACTAELLDSPPRSAGPTRSNSGLPPSIGATAASHALSCGVDECVKKPLSYSKLCSILERYIPHWAGPLGNLMPRSTAATASAPARTVDTAPPAATAAGPVAPQQPPVPLPVPLASLSPLSKPPIKRLTRHNSVLTRMVLATRASPVGWSPVTGTAMSLQQASMFSSLRAAGQLDFAQLHAPYSRSISGEPSAGAASAPLPGAAESDSDDSLAISSSSPLPQGCAARQAAVVAVPLRPTALQGCMGGVEEPSRVSTPCPGSQEPDIQEHLVELAALLGAEQQQQPWQGSGQAGSSSNSALQAGSWGDPSGPSSNHQQCTVQAESGSGRAGGDARSSKDAAGSSQAGLPHVGEAVLRRSQEEARRSREEEWQQKLAVFSGHPADEDSGATGDEGSEREGGADVERVWGGAGALPPHHHQRGRSSRSPGAGERGMGQGGSSGSDGPWLDMGEGALSAEGVKALCAWDAEDYEGLQGAAAVLQAAHDEAQAAQDGSRR